MGRCGCLLGIDGLARLPVSLVVAQAASPAGTAHLGSGSPPQGRQNVDRESDGKRRDQHDRSRHRPNEMKTRKSTLKRTSSRYAGSS
jgi:hypothetical protein